MADHKLIKVNCDSERGGGELTGLTKALPNLQVTVNTQTHTISVARDNAPKSAACIVMDSNSQLYLVQSDSATINPVIFDFSSISGALAGFVLTEENEDYYSEVNSL